MEVLDLYTELVNAGVPVSGRESDLYVPITPLSKAIVLRVDPARLMRRFEFTCQITGVRHWDFPFQYTPFWQNVARKAARVRELQEVKF